MSESSAAAVDAQTQVAIGRFRLAMQGQGTARVVTMTAMAAVYVMLWRSHPHWVALAWFGGGSALTLARWLYLRRFGRTPIDSASLPLWNRNIFVSAVLNGLLWGIACAFFAGSDTPFNLGAMAVVASGAILSGLWLVSIPHAFTVFAVLVFSPSIGLIAANLTPSHVALASFMSVALVGAVRLGGNVERMIVATLQSRQEKEEALIRLAQQTERAEVSSREKSRFLAVASHDLRQPLQALAMFIATLDPHVETAEARHVLARATQALQSLTELFDALLDISRLDLGQVLMVHEPVPLAPMFEELRERFAPLAARKSLRLRVCATRATVNSDPVQLQRIIGNLVNNAIVYTERGSVCLCTRRAGADVRIEVRDSGPGIPAAEHDAIFHEFHQLAGAARDRQKGLGLGLAIVRRMADQLGHRVTLQSEPARGSVFGIVVPRARSEEPVAARAALAEEDLSGIAVLVVDDDGDVREAIGLLLRRWGCEVWEADGGAGAAETLDSRGRAPDVVLCDYRLRDEETGIGVIDALRQRWGRDVPAALISGESGEDSEARAAGLLLMRKPVRPATLRALLRSLTRGAKQSNDQSI